jgi:hypothetical protein
METERTSSKLKVVKHYGYCLHFYDDYDFKADDVSDTVQDLT